MNTIPVMRSIKDLEAASGLKYETIRRWCLTGEVISVRVGRNGGKFLVNEQSFIEKLNRGDRAE